MKNIVEQLSAYKSVHLNPSNIKTHFVGIPMIIWSLFLLLGMVRFDTPGGQVSVAMIFTLVVLIYYMWLHVKLAMGMVVFILPVLYTTEAIVGVPYALWIALAVFVVGWIFQLIGHQYEKAKPAFVDDMNQLLIGPIFLMAEVYFYLGWEKGLEQEITPIAKQKRMELEAAKAS
ncbi:DUF962 domain-containing protein [Shewanella submarina]|uniref:DUF962 domain-containing protein n=1 Tax=Shewanella submarina TaxID=2016376 RepID=A0ABV7GAJ6_9GAMM|nr:Mpo1-like protein [Shewanella submarina]MCL1036915.1 DUF962 domain-containing protein [Shewanella submarina]